ncbi:MAG: penicillin-binding protein 2 [Anaerolineae bacterium]|nr:MAG: penicillin-binding protein 2 [Anaerolineae bacterium]
MIQSWRLRVTLAAMGVLMAVFIGRLFFLQFTMGDFYSTQADDNRFDRVSIPAPRGVVYDSNGSLLVRNLPAFNVYVTPALLPDSKAEIEATFMKLSELTGVPLDQPGPPAAPCVAGRGIQQLVEEGATNRPFDAWPVACDIDETTARVLRQQQIDMPGVSVEAVPVREYPTGNLTSAVIGYLGPIPAAQVDYWESLGFLADRDKVGYGGVELNYQDILAGQNGLKLVEKDVAGSLLAEVGPGNPAVPGNNLKLTIDTRLQAIAASALQNRMEFINRVAGDVQTTIGAVIAMNPQTGEILAMVSIPSYENNRLTRFIPEYYFRQLSEDASKPLVNHAVSSSFPPGSSFKMVTAVGVLNEGIIDPNRTLFNTGKITIQNAYFPNDPGQAKDFVCWKADGHGYVDFIHAIAWSCNVYFYKVGGGFEDEVPDGGLGIEALGVYARALGYGSPLGIDLPGEEDGLIPNKDWKRLNLGENWSTGDTYNSVVGQGFVAATPLQVLTSISTIANGGRVMWPHVVQEVLDGEGNVQHRYEPCVLWDIADGVLMEDTSEIAAGCDSLDPELRDKLIAGYSVSPDITVDPGVLDLAREGMRLVVEDEEGTANPYAVLDGISSGGKTGTGEFCDETAFKRNLCEPGNWPSHSWYTAFAPYENPEIAVVAFVYNGEEGAITAGPIVKQVMEAYFELKAIDAAR